MASRQPQRGNPNIAVRGDALHLRAASGGTRLVNSFFDGGGDLGVSHPVPPRLRVTPKLVQRTSRKLPLQRVRGEFIDGLPFGRGHLPRFLKESRLDRDVLLGCHDRLRQVYAPPDRRPFENGDGVIG
jgi:hypothetical protein